MKAVDGKKYCFGCKETKAVDEFNRNWGASDGYQGLCRFCQKLERMARADRNRAINKERAGVK
jgi:hypothetical protein